MPNWGKKQTSTSGRLDNSHQNQQNQANIQTYCKQTCKLQWQERKTLKSSRTRDLHLEGKTHKASYHISEQKLGKPQASDITYSKYWMEKSAAKNTLSNKAIIQNGRRHRLPQTKTKGVFTTKPVLQEILRGSLWVERRDQKWQYEGKRHKSSKTWIFL